jgi:plasmid stabilization system protein ParE
MRRVLWTRNARSALQEAKTYLEQQRRGTADRLSSDIFKAAKAIANLPLAGRVDRGVQAHVWSLPKWHKLIIYRVRGDEIQIVAFRDTRQDT